MPNDIQNFRIPTPGEIGELFRKKKEAFRKEMERLRIIAPQLPEKPNCGEGRDLLCCKHEFWDNWPMLGWKAHVEYCEGCEKIFFPESLKSL